MRVYVKENVRYMGNGKFVPDGTWYAISGATMACVASGMTLARIKEWCGEHHIGIIGVIHYDPTTKAKVTRQRGTERTWNG